MKATLNDYPNCISMFSSQATTNLMSSTTLKHESPIMLVTSQYITISQGSTIQKCSFLSLSSTTDTRVETYLKWSCIDTSRSNESPRSAKPKPINAARSAQQLNHNNNCLMPRQWLDQPVSKNERRPSSEIIESFPTLEPSLNIFKTEERTNIIHDLFSQPAVLQVKTIHLYLVGVAHKANATSSGCITTAPNRTSRKATIISLQATCCTLITKIRQFHHPNSLTSIVLNPHNKIPTGVQNLFYCSRWVWFNRTLRKEFSYKQH